MGAQSLKPSLRWRLVAPSCPSTSCAWPSSQVPSTPGAQSVDSTPAARIAAGWSRLGALGASAWCSGYSNRMYRASSGFASFPTLAASSPLQPRTLFLLWTPFPFRHRKCCGRAFAILSVAPYRCCEGASGSGGTDDTAFLLRAACRGRRTRRRRLLIRRSPKTRCPKMTPLPVSAMRWESTSGERLSAQTWARA